jgi:hypothetical protein
VEVPYQMSIEYRDPSRGTGRTTRMVEQTQDGDIIVVHSRNMIPYIKRLPAAQGKKLRFIVVQDSRDEERLRGIEPSKIHWDHYAREELCRKHLERILLRLVVLSNLLGEK